jgi:hypothetical protein
MVQTRSGRKTLKAYPKHCKGRPINNCRKSRKCKTTKAGIRASYCRKSKNNRHM